jgi:hypothetical protein
VSRPLPLKQKQVTALAKGAAAAGCIAEVKIGDVFVRLVPIDHPQAARPIDAAANPEAFDTLDEYLAWRDRSGAREN